MKPLFAAILATALLTGAIGQHASQHDIEQCKMGAGRAVGDQDGPGNDGAETAENSATFEAVVTCLRSMGYVWVQDAAGICDEFIQPRCFERD